MKTVLQGLLAAASLASLAVSAPTQWDPVRGSVRAMTFEATGAPRHAGTAEEAARAFLDSHRTLFNGRGLVAAFAEGAADEGPAPEVKMTRLDDTGSMRFVRFAQEVDGLPVDGGDLVVAVRADGSVSSVQGGYAAAGHDVRVRGFAEAAPIAADDAVASAKAEIAAEKLGDYQSVRLVWWVDADGKLVKSHRVDIAALRPRGDWRVFVAADDGRVLSKQNLLLFHHAHDEAAAADAPKGQVYLTNPMRDANKVEVTLERLTSPDKLIGEYVRVNNGKHETITAADGNFVVDESSTHFAEVGAYYHIDKIHQNLKEIDPDFTGMDWQIPITVHDKGSFFVKKDNAFYSPFKKAMFILDPEKLNDLHLEAGVAYHEYHHAVTDNIVPGLNSVEGRAMHEGYSDYFACVLTDDPELGEWALQPLNKPHMRDLRSQRKYPQDLHPEREPHSDGEIWGAACWDLRKVIPADKADFLVHRSRFYLSGNATFKAAYQGMLQADADFLGGEFHEQIKAVFTARGIAGDTVDAAGRSEDAPEAARARIGFEALHGHGE